jgi:selenophosphate synthetase-related protein
MTIVAVVNEMLTLGKLSQNAAPSDLKGWLKSFYKEGVVTKYQHKSLQQVLSQMYHFKKDVSMAQNIFGEVKEKSTSIMGKY